MFIDKQLIIEAKQIKGVSAAFMIAEDLELVDFDERKIKSRCPFHDEDTGSFIWSNDDMAYKCFGCGIRYGIIDHYMKFYKLTYLESLQKLFEEAEINFNFGEKGLKAKRDYVYPERECSNNRTKVEEYLVTRGISKETLDYCDVQSDDQENCVFHFYDLNDTLCTVKYRPARKLSKKDTKTWSQKGADTLPLLFNMNKVEPSKPLIITEGEIDTLTLIECGLLNSVSVPFGANNYGWIEQNWDFLEQFNKIIVWSDNDEAGIKMRKEVCSRLGTWRTLFVDITDNYKVELNEKIVKPKDINEVYYFFGRNAIFDLISNAQEVPVPDVADLSKVEEFDIEKAQGLVSSLANINNIIYKYVFGSVVLFTGSRGSGKSSYINQEFICEALNQGYDTFIFSGELNGSVLKNWIETTMAGKENIRMKNDFVRVIPTETKTQMREWYKGRIWEFDGKTNNADEILDRAVSVTRRFGVKIWILDNLMTLDIGISDTGNELIKQKDFMAKLTRLADLYNVLIVLVAHPRKMSEMRKLMADDVAGSGSLGNLAQYIVGVHRFSQSEKEGELDQHGKYRKGREPIDEDVEIEFFKNRYTGKVGSTKAFFDYPSMRFYNTSKELNKRYKWNNDTSPIPAFDPKDKNIPPNFQD